MAIRARMIAPPEDEPITLDEAKLYAGLTWTSTPESPDPRDALMTGFIAAARSTIERRTGLALLTQTHEITYTSAPCTCLELPGQCRPVQTITSVDPPGLLLVPVGAAPVVAFAAVPDAAAVPTTVVVQVVSGWIDAATLKAAEPALTHAVGLLTAHYATLGRDIAALGTPMEVPHGFEELIAPFLPVAI